MIRYLLTTISILLLCASCEKLEEYKAADENNTDSSYEDNGGSSYGNDDDDEGVIDIASVRSGLRCGTKECPYLPSDFCEGGAFTTIDEDDLSDDIWVIGYIVGYVKGTTISSTVFDVGDKETNIVLADSRDVTDTKMLIPVQLTKSAADYKEVREMLNLASNPENLGKVVEVRGYIDTYMGVNGLKGANKTVFITEKD